MKKIVFCLIIFILQLTIINHGNCQSQITMTTASNVQEVEIKLSGRGKVTIDWGDGSKDNITNINSFPDASHSEYRHVYSDTLPHIIKIIRGEIYGIITNNNLLTGIDISQYARLRILICDNNCLANLNISKNSKLFELRCDKNYLKYLDLSKNTNLRSLTCSNNQLTNLDVSKNVKLKYLECNFNQLTNLDLSANKLLYGFRCAYNNFSEIALNEIFRSLCDAWDENKTLKYTKRKYNRYRRNKPINDGYLFISGNPGTDSCDKSIAESKGWRFITW